MDCQLAEATKCFLCGFNRAAAVLSASAVESRLKRISGFDRFATFAELVAAARRAAGFSERIGDYARRVFAKRNAVVHQGTEPAQEDAGEVVTLARSALSDLPPAQDPAV